MYYFSWIHNYHINYKKLVIIFRSLYIELIYYIGGIVLIINIIIVVN